MALRNKIQRDESSKIYLKLTIGPAKNYLPNRTAPGIFPFTLSDAFAKRLPFPIRSHATFFTK